MDNIKVSIIIPAFNSQKTIQQTLQAVLNQSYDNCEVIVVDDGSTDMTRSIVESFSAVKYFFQRNAGPASARNLGAQRADGSVLFFTDADCIPRRDWVEASFKGFESDDVAAVAGSYGIANDYSALARCIQNEIAFRHARFLPLFIRAFGSYNCAIKKKVFEEVGGFDETYPFASGEDNDLSYKILKSNKRIRFVKDSLVDHYHTERILKYLQQQFRHGFWRAKMYKTHPKMLKGDDYTFWKDIVEVPASVAIMALIILAWVFPGTFCVVLFWLMCLILGMEVFFSFRMNKTLSDKILFGFIMILRAMARSVGFTLGVMNAVMKK